MRITPLDVRKQEFRRVVRGLDPEEVSAFLSTVADEYEAVLVDNKQLRERILELDEKISEYRNMEKTLRDTLMTAERVMNETKDNAMKEADLILRDAELRVQQVHESFRQQALELRREILSLHQEKESYLARFRGLAEAQIQFVDHHQTDFEKLDDQLMEMVNAVDRPRRSEPRTRTAPATPDAPAGSRPANRPGPVEDVWRNYSPEADAAERRDRLASLLAPAEQDAPAPAPATPEPAPRDALDEAATAVARLAPFATDAAGPPPTVGDDGAEPAVRDEAAEPAPAAAPAPAEPEKAAVAADGEVASRQAAPWSQDSFAKGLGEV
jgi:cell division initiation protein